MWPEGRGMVWGVHYGHLDDLRLGGSKVILKPTFHSKTGPT